MRNWIGSKIEWIASYVPESVKLTLFLFLVVGFVAANDACAMTSMNQLQYSSYAKAQIQKEYELKNQQAYLMPSNPVISEEDKKEIRAINLGVTKKERILPTVRAWERGKYGIKTCRGIKTVERWEEEGLEFERVEWKCQSVRGRETMEDFIARDGSFHSYGINLSKDYPEIVIKYKKYK